MTDNLIDGFLYLSTMIGALFLLMVGAAFLLVMVALLMHVIAALNGGNRPTMATRTKRKDWP